MIHKTTRSILSVLLAALLLVTSIPLTPAFADGGAVSPQSESGESEGLTGSGAANDPYQIGSADDLRAFAQRVNNGQIRADADAVLTDDIDLNPDMKIDEDGKVTNGDKLAQWTPIGNSSPYSGTFNGAGHTISGLYINDSTADDQGLFGYVSGTVQNLSVSGSVSGSDHVGGVVGQNNGTVTNCAFSGSVSGVGPVGGVVGYNISSVTNCYNTGEVSGNWYVGGVVGDNGGTVEGYNGGTVEGWNRGTVENCYNTGTVTGTGDYVGGVVGYNSSIGNVKNCYNTGKVIGSSVGGVVGDNHSSGNVTGCYFLQSTAASGIGGGNDSADATPVDDLSELCNAFNDTNTWTISDTLKRPVLTSNHEDDGTQAHPYEIFTAIDLKNFRDLVDGANGNPAAWAVLMENIDLEGSEEWTPIGSIRKPYSGTFDGNGKTISGLYIGITANNQGLFGYVDPGGTVQNLSVSGSVSGNRNVGGVVGYNNGGTVTGCIFSGSGSVSGDRCVGGIVGYNGTGATVSNCYNTGTGTVTGTDDYVGGVVGYNDNNGSVKNCYNTGTVTGTVTGTDDYVGGVVGYNSGTVENCYNIGEVSGNRYVGGVVGDNSGSVTNCYNTDSGTVKGNNYVGGVVGNSSGGFSASVTNCYNTGSVSGNNYVGGVVGNSSGGFSASVTNCYNTGSVSGNNYVGGVVGNSSGGFSASVTNCYNTDSGTVKGNNYVGGVVGYNISSTVENCYNTGSVSGDWYVGGVVGYNSSSGNVTGCYFLQTETVNTKLQGIGDGSGTFSNVEARTADAFHSGEVAWRLQDGQKAAGEEDPIPQVWGQSKLGETTSLPTLVALDKDAKPVYKVVFISDNTEIEAQYANSGMTVTPPEAPEKTDHLFGGWFNNGELTGDPVTGLISVTGNATYTAKWTPFSYTLSATPDTLNFGSITEGEERPAAQTVTVKNTGNQRVTLVQPTAENFEIGKLSETTLEPTASATFTIQPKEKLPRGSYSEQITISGNDGASATLTATFTVKEPPYTGKYSYEVFTSVGDNGAISVDRYATEGDKVTIDVTADQAYKLDELVVTANGKDVELTANSDGTYTFTMPSADVKITATFAEDPDWTEPEPEEPSTDVSDLFIDIAPDAWYKDAVQYAYDHGLMTGVSATEFAPEQTTTRAMIVSILARLENVTTAEAAGFADVDDNDWYATAVNWAANVGVVNGYEDNTFQPNTAITREQLAAILMNYAAYKGYDVSARADLSHYSDADSISSWANDVLLWAVAEGLLTGVTDDTIAPQAHATRAQVAAILQRFLSE